MNGNMYGDGTNRGYNADNVNGGYAGSNISQGNGGYAGNGMPQGNGRNVRKNQKNGLGAGIGIGVIIGLLVSGILIFVLFAAVSSAGIIKVGENGKIYVQPINIDDSEGIGSAIEGKLNSLDSLLDRFYFNDVDEQKATDEIFKAYLNAYGDKYTVYYSPEEYKALMESTSGTFYGIGALCQKNDDGTILVVEAYENAPAYKAGVRDGDHILKVDGRDITGMDLTSGVALIKGEKGTNVELELIRNGETLKINIQRDEVTVETVVYEMLEGGIGYLAITQFDEVTTKQYKAAVAELKAQGMKGLVVDIRSNPGGLLNTVTEILDEILPNGLIVYTEDKSGSRKEYKGSNNSELDIPLAVLVDGNSASASEIFAGAVQDYGKGKIIGTQTYGKGIVQSLIPLSDGSAVKLTTAKYFTPKGQDIHGKGVTPDEVVELPENAETDTQLEAALNYIKGKIE